jgi:hypothetical protein
LRKLTRHFHGASFPSGGMVLALQSKV